MRINVTVQGLDQARADFADFSDRRFAAAVATALTRTAGLVRDDVRRQMPSIFDRPTAYTMNSLFVRPATAQRLQADVWFKDDSATSRQGTPATKYLLPHVQGGERRTKRYERALQMAGHLPSGWLTVPGEFAKMDAHGNISHGQIIQILSQLRITLTAGHTRNMSFDARKQIAAQRRAGGRYFVIAPGNKQGTTPGVYLREFAGRSIMPVLIFVQRSAYTPRFPFDRITQASAARHLNQQLARAFAEQAARLRRTP